MRLPSPSMFRFAALLLVGLLVTVGAWLGQPDQEILARQWLRSRLDGPVKQLLAIKGPSSPLRIAIKTDPLDPALVARVKDALRFDGRVVWISGDHTDQPADHTLTLQLDSSAHQATLSYQIDDGPQVRQRVAWYAILPPLLAVIIAILFRHVILCLATGILLAGILVVLPTAHSPFYGIWYAVNTYFLQYALLGTFRIEIIAFVLLICATVGIAQQSGGIAGAIDLVTRFCRTARSARLGAAIAGIVIFFDDYMNCIIVGNSLRPLTDRYRVSRAKLAYIVDSTAAPVAGLALVSTWIAFETTQIKEGLIAAGLTIEPFSVFVQSIPYRFYCVFTLALVFILAWTGRDYGAMLSSERRAIKEGPPVDPAEDGLSPAVHRSALYAFVPIGITFMGIMIGLWWTAQPVPGEPPIRSDSAMGYLQDILARTKSATAFWRASAIGYILAVLMVLAGRILPPRQIIRASFFSIRAILGALVILFLAWSIGAACRDIGTADYLMAMFHKVMRPVGFSLVVFGLGCLISFSTGTSYGTMALLLPNVVPLALAVGESSSLGGMGLVIMSVGAVLEGSIFGDHCSPISDTTILSAASSKCELIEHVRTQMPYALTAMLTAAVIGYIPVSLGFSPWISMAAGCILLLAVVRCLGRLPNASTEATTVNN